MAVHVADDARVTVLTLARHYRPGVYLPRDTWVPTPDVL
jgi:hypothetical protein